jgi:hypothetical protein
MACACNCHELCPKPFVKQPIKAGSKKNRRRPTTNAAGATRLPLRKNTSASLRKCTSSDCMSTTQKRTAALRNAGIQLFFFYVFYFIPNVIVNSHVLHIIPQPFFLPSEKITTFAITIDG